MFTAARVNMEALRDLMRADMNIDATDTRGDTALLLAAEAGDLQAAVHLKRNGAWIDCRNLAGATPLLLAARNGHVPLVRKLLKTWGANAGLSDKSGCTPLHHAVSGGHTHIVRMLIDAGVNLDPLATNGYTPFLMAVLCDRCDAAHILLQAGCNPYVQGTLVDFLAVIGGNPDMLDVLSQYAGWKNGLAKRHNASANLCKIAAEKGNSATVRWLVKAGLPFEPLPRMLFGALEKYDNDMVRLLLDHGLPPDTMNPEGRTALWKAVESASTSVVDSLLCKGADMFSKSHPEMLLLKAIRTGSASLVMRLLQDGQWTTSIVPPMLLAAELGHKRIVACLLDAGFAHETPDRAKSAALVAAEHGHLAVVCLLHQRGAGGDEDQCRLQLLNAIRKHHVPVVALLLQKISKVDVEIEQCALSCMSMAEQASLDIIDLLLAARYPVQPGNLAGLEDSYCGAEDFQAFSNAMLEAAALSDIDAGKRMQELGIRSANRSALLALARTVLKISPDLMVKGAREHCQRSAAFGLLLAAGPCNEAASEDHDEFSLIKNARLQRKALGVAGNEHFNTVCSTGIGKLLALGLAHSNIRLEANGLEKALNEAGALLPSLASKMRNCWNDAILTAFETLRYQGPVAGLTACLQTKLPCLLAESLLHWFNEAVRPAVASKLEWTGDALSPEAALKHILKAQQDLLRLQADLWAIPPGS